MNYQLLREEMVDSLGRLGITSTEVLNAMRQVPRHLFLDSAFALNKAYSNQAWTIGHGQTISQPYIVARMTEIISRARRARVLEIGTGSGYQAAILSFLFEQVYTIERIGELHSKSSQLLEEALGYTNIYCHLGDGKLGWPDKEFHPFDAIICTAAATGELPELFNQLADPGVLIMPAGPNPAAQFLYVYHQENGHINKDQLEQVSFVPVLPGTEGEPYYS